MHTHKVAIIGAAGNVGASIAFTLIAQAVPIYILVVDIADKQVEGQASDLNDAAYLSCSNCRKGSFKEAGQCDVIIVSAGAKQLPGEQRSKLIDRNYKVMESIIESIQPIKPTAKILIISNPVDVLTQIVQKLSNHPKHLVLGSGTFLDTGRLRNYLGDLISVNPSSIHAYVLGEHGDNQFIGWSCANIAGMPLLDHPKLKNIQLDEIKSKIAQKAYEIIESKGSTYYGIASHVAYITQSLLQDADKVLPISNYNKDDDCYYSWPAVIGLEGVKQRIDVSLNEEEKVKLGKAISQIKGLANKYCK